jgi:hypothetical protein
VSVHRLFPPLRLCLGLVLLATSVRAQTDRAQAGAPLASPPPTLQQVTGYPVVGRVLCADTQRPARFAQVMLVPASTNVSDYDRGRMAVGRTDLDGRFAIDNVPPGDYYATAEMTGYINDVSNVRLALSQGGDALNSIASVPRVQVTAGGASVQLSLQRGGVVSGAVQWDDGSPAAGVQVSVQAATTSNGAPATQTGIGSGAGFGRPPAFFGPNGGGQTDDRGRFRLSGLPPGSYVLRASVQSPQPAQTGNTAGNGRFPRLMTLNVYAPNKLRRSDATVITLAAGEERQDVNIVLGLAGMHVVSGQVSASSAAVHSGTVNLTDQNDSSLTRTVAIGPDGSFTVPYVPPGTYTLRVTASSALQTYGRGGSSPGDTRFQPLQESVTVADGDLTGVNVTVTPATTATTSP